MEDVNRARLEREVEALYLDIDSLEDYAELLEFNLNSVTFRLDKIRRFLRENFNDGKDESK